MSESPEPGHRLNLSRAAILGFALGASGVGLFVILWLLLDSWGIGQIPRLAISVCMPPALLSALVGAYFLLYQPRDSS